MNIYFVIFQLCSLYLFLWKITFFKPTLNTNYGKFHTLLTLHLSKLYKLMLNTQHIVLGLREFLFFFQFQSKLRMSLDIFGFAQRR